MDNLNPNIKVDIKITSLVSFYISFIYNDILINILYYTFEKDINIDYIRLTNNINDVYIKIIDMIDFINLRLNIQLKNSENNELIINDIKFVFTYDNILVYNGYLYYAHVKYDEYEKMDNLLKTHIKDNYISIYKNIKSAK